MESIEILPLIKSKSKFKKFMVSKYGTKSMSKFWNIKIDEKSKDEKPSEELNPMFEDSLKCVVRHLDYCKIKVPKLHKSKTKTPKDFDFEIDSKRFDDEEEYTEKSIDSTDKIPKQVISISELFEIFKKLVEEPYKVSQIFTLPHEYGADVSYMTTEIITPRINYEPRIIFNLECLNPYLTSDTYLFDYHIFQRLMPTIVTKEFIDKLYAYVVEMKSDLYSDQFSGIEKVQQFLYFVKNLFVFNTYNFIDFSDSSLIQLSDICNEFRFLPNPYGEMANELCEILENESLFPTITRLKKLIEDFPNIAEFDIKGEGKSLSQYQNVFVYEK